MRVLESKIDQKIANDLKSGLNLLNDNLDLAQDLIGARQQLKQQYVQKNESAILARLSEKPLSALTEVERNLLKGLGSKPKSK